MLTYDVTKPVFARPKVILSKHLGLSEILIDGKPLRYSEFELKVDVAAGEQQELVIKIPLHLIDIELKNDR